MGLDNILALVIVFLIFMIVVLLLIYFSMTMKEKNNTSSKSKEDNKQETTKSSSIKEYTKESIFKFMEFEKIENNMIIQKDNKKFLMAIECQGINYDLMSAVEKTAVESGFIQFLNTLRNPIQIYVQTRTINLSDSLKRYKDKLKKVEDELVLKENKYKIMKENGNYQKGELEKHAFEINRQKNLYEYGKDIIFNTERMSMNKNVLRKKYYIILSYYFNSTDAGDIKETDIVDMAFSELYTQSQVTVRSLAMAGITASVLDSYELVNLLYNAYNRDEAENYGIERAISAGYDSLYITSRDILQRKMEAIQNDMADKALELAKESIRYANENLKKQIKETEKDFEELVKSLAEDLIDENEGYLPDELIEESKKQVRKVKKGAIKNGKTKQTNAG